MMNEILEIALGKSRRKNCYSNHAVVRVEELEPRIMLSTFKYVGDPKSANSNWTTTANWSIVGKADNNHKYPNGPSDTAIFDTTPAGNHADGTPAKNVTVNLAFPGELGTLTILPAYTGTITLSRSMQLLVGFNQGGGTIDGTQPLKIGGGKNQRVTGFISAGVTYNAPNSNTLTIADGSELKINPGTDQTVNFNNWDITVSHGAKLTVNNAIIRFTGNFKEKSVSASITNFGIITTSGKVLMVHPPSTTQTVAGVNSIGDRERFNVQSGTTEIQMPFGTEGLKTSVPDIIVADKATLVLSGGGEFTNDKLSKNVNFVLNGAGSKLIFKGTARFLVDNATLQLKGAGTASIQGGVSINLGLMKNGGIIELNDNVTLELKDGVISHGGLNADVGIRAKDGSKATIKLVKGTLSQILVLFYKGSQLQISGGKLLGDNGKISNVGGTTTLQGGDFTIGLGAEFSNITAGKDVAKFIIKDNSNIKNESTEQLGGGTFNNEKGAEFIKEGGNGQSKIDPSFINRGKVVVSSGTLKIPRETQQGKNRLKKATTELNGGKLNTDGLLQLEGGVLENDGVSAQNGEVFGDVRNTGGEVDPGGVGSTGILTIDGTNGTYTQSGSGSLHIDIAGPTPGTQYDRLVVTGTVTLGGKLTIHAVPGFTGNSFDLLVNESGQPIQGEFDGLPEGAEITLDGRQFFLTYHGGASGNDVVLNAGMVTLNKLNGTITGIVSFNDGQGHSGSENVYLSQLNVTYTTGPGRSVTFNTFCIDLFHTVAVGQEYAVNARADLDAFFANAARMEEIYQHYGMQNLSNDPDLAAAEQLLEWDLLLNNHDPQSFGLDPGTTSEYSSGDPNVFDVNFGNNPDAAKIAGEANTLLKESIGATTSGAWLDAGAAGDAANRGQSLLIPEAALQQIALARASQWASENQSAGVNGLPADADFAILSQLAKKPAGG